MIVQAKELSYLPERIKVGPISYNIATATDPVAPVGEEEIPVYGMVNFRRTLITIADDLSPILQWQCLFHELFHIFFEHLGLDMPGDSEEGQIDSLAYMLLDFMVDNGFLHLPAQESLYQSSVFPFPHTKEKVEA
jgi:hypothetical protein